MRAAPITGAESTTAPRYCIKEGCGVLLSRQMRSEGLDYCEVHWNAIMEREMNPEGPPEYDLGIDEVFA